MILMMSRRIPLSILNLNESDIIWIAVVSLMMVLWEWEVLYRYMGMHHVFLMIENSSIYLFYSKIHLSNKYLSYSTFSNFRSLQKYSVILRYNFGNERKLKNTSIR